jgi:hypothetical protein
VHPYASTLPARQALLVLLKACIQLLLLLLRTLPV